MGDTSGQRMDLEPDQETRLIQKSIDEFIEKEIHPLENEYDQFLGEYGRRNKLTDDGYLTDEYVELRNEVKQRAAEAGFFTLHMPEEVGGGGLTRVQLVQIIEHLHDRNPDGFHNMIIGRFQPTAMYHDDYLREKYFDPWARGDMEIRNGTTEPQHGSDANYMDTTAEKDGDEWVINGTKAFISFSTIADAIVVIARTSGEDGSVYGLSAFVVDRDNPGWEVGKAQQPMNDDDAGGLAINHFTDCRVPDSHMIAEEGRGLIEVALKRINRARLRIPAKAVGSSEWMLGECIDYAEQRETFGEPIGTNQFVKGLISDVRADIEQVRWFTRAVAYKHDRGDGERWETSAVKLRGSELWTKAADTAIQIHGGAGFMKSLPFEGAYRHARRFRIVDGTDEIHKRNIANELLDLD